MTVYEFVDLCIDPSILKVEIYSLDAGDVVWMGYGDEIPSKYEDVEIDSYDVPTKKDRITLNID